jgi:uncharacterized protein YceK
MKMLIVLVAIVGLSGCASAFTSIQPAGENNYYVTMNKNNGFKQSGTLYQCQAQGEKMTCTEINGQ